MTRIRIATRKSPLALVQSGFVTEHLRSTLGAESELVKIVTTGDRQTEWSLEGKGGKGLFTGELEQSLLRGEADIAVHSSKDLPGAMGEGLALAGYLPRADARDVLVRRSGVDSPRLLATASPRRRLQSLLRFPGIRHTEIRGNVDTRLRKIAEGQADATILAAAGLARLGIASWPGVEFEPFALEQMVPAVGQGAIAIQCRSGDLGSLSAVLDGPTARVLRVERAIQNALGGGCHTAFGAHVVGDTLHFFHEKTGIRKLALTAADFADPDAAAVRILSSLGLP
jgi:hydroxymethylbilane synthase